MGYGTNIFLRKNIVGIEVKPNNVVKVNFDDESSSTYSTVAWSVNRDPDIDGVTNTGGMVHMVQDGSIQGLGFFGYRVSNEFPLIVNGTSMTSIDDIKEYLISNL